MFVRRILGLSALGLIFVSFEMGFTQARNDTTTGGIPFTSHDSTSNAAAKTAAGDAGSYDRVRIDNIANVPFGEARDLIRAVSPAKRSSWARELENLSFGVRKNGAVETFYKIWIGIDPAAAIRFVSEIHDPRLQQNAFYSMAKAAADSDLPALAELQFQLGYRTDNRGPWSILTRWSEIDPESAARFLEAHPDTASNNFADVADAWASLDPEKAAHWVTNLALPPLHDPIFPHSEDTRRLDAIRSLLESWLQNDRAAAANFAVAHAMDSDVSAALKEFTFDLAKKSLDDAAMFIRALPSSESRRAALTDLIPEAGSRVIVVKEGGDDEEPEDPPVSEARLDRWLVSLPSELWFEHVGGILIDWNSSDPTGADAWLHGLPTTVQSKAASEFCAYGSAEDAQRVLELSNLIDDPRARDEALEKFVSALDQGGGDVRAAIDALAITPGQKQKLRGLVHSNQ